MQNIICLLLLEITQYLRETYQYMPKRVNQMSSSKHETFRQTTKINPDQKTNNTFHDNNSHSVIQQDLKSGLYSKHETNIYSNNKRPSAEIASVTLTAPPDNVNNYETSKHISFAFTEKLEDQVSLNSIKLRNTTPPPPHSEALTQDLKVANKTNKSSIRRSSLKYRSDRLNRANTILNSNRKLSRETNESIQGNDESNASVVGFQTNFIYSNDDINKLDENSKSHHHSTRDISAQINDTCEVDEVDFNRCYPWIKVIFDANIQTCFKNVTYCFFYS